MSWILFALSSVVSFTFLNLLQRVLAVDSKHPRAMAVLFNGTAALIALLIFAFSGAYKSFSLPTEPQAWIALLIASFCYGMFERGRFVAAKLLDASVLTTIINISVVIAIIGSSWLYSEPLTSTKLFGGALILIALLMVSFGNQTKKSPLKGVFVGILISIMLGLGWMLDKLGTQYFNSGTYNILIWILPTVFIFFPYIKLEVINSELKVASWKVFLLAGLNVIGYLMQLKALEIAEATRVIPILQTSTLFTVLLGVVFLREREHILRKVLAGIIAVTGAYFLI